MKKIKTWLFTALFKISNQPILLRDLLEANALFNEGMLVDPSKLNYKFKFFSSYLVYFALCAIVLLPLLAITHYFFTKIDFHLSIISTVAVTACVFIFYDIFKIYTRKLISKELIQKAWKLHFPFFPYEKYSKIVENIYNEALKKEIPKTSLEAYILEQIIKFKDN
ncbi:hypothetical protein DMB92_05460 [Campylobacter sp. MIT 99-7217]|uniref:hypothetical protein n=1 Tax=Campylobacter sp. MIT 99-7217 TaxID=535091 RepID=UPI00115BB42E|nr:hypothetical protein [Campylobacter sp. MIT 99-7217]TQR31835.1 hypothetical protein DMB92_05460 [Campylobacter sp. MIT 99-7217]